MRCSIFLAFLITGIFSIQITQAQIINIDKSDTADYNKNRSLILISIQDWK